MTTLFSNARKLDADGIVEGFWMLADGDTIAATGTGEAPDATTRVDVDGAWLVPGFIDLHAHGGGGHSYDNGTDEMLAGIAVHRAHGTTRSVVSLVANPLASLRTSIAEIAELAAVDPLILGSHLEGPFLSQPRRGAHNAQFLREPQLTDIDELVDAARGTLRQVTLAPELPGALDAIASFVGSGVRVAVGHTEATFELAREAFDAGATILTHAFNAMPGIHHRAPGPVIAAFEDERITIELILDGHHVHPDVAALAFTSAPGRIALVTDAMAAAGSHDGDYSLGSLTVSVRDGIAMLRGTTTIAGSTLTQDAALRVAINRSRIDPRIAVEALTRTPARAIGMHDRFGMLAAGFAADAVVLDAAWQVQQVWAAGARVTPVLAG